MNAPVDPVYLRRGEEAAEMRALRIRINKARTRCLSRASRSGSCDAGTWMLRASQMAAAWAWAPASVDQLEDVIRLLTALHLAANAAERLEAANGD